MGRRLLALLAAAVILVTAGAAFWWWSATRPVRSASGVNLGRAAAGAKNLNLLVITLDTTRADRIGAYGYQNIETPTIDRLAREGVLFEQAMTAAPLTLPAHCTIFTSRFPPEHGVRDNGGFFLSPKQLTLATYVKGRGFRTGAVVAAYVLDRKWGIAQGFDSYIDDFELAGHGGFGLGDIQRPANDVVDRALPWLEKVKNQRFFAWLHFYDPHQPYDAPEPFKSRYANHPYNAEIAFMDSQIARVIEFFERNGLLDRTVIAVIGDHGESLNQHGEGSHGFFIYEATTRVPFIIRAPFDRAAGGRRVADPVRSVDLVPTVLDLMGIAPPQAIAGVSLVPLMTGDRGTLDLEGYAEAMYPLHHFGWSDLRAWRTGRYKVIDAPRPELYDLDRDPQEDKNIYADRRALADGMLSRLRAREKDTPGNEGASKPAIEVDPEARARLAALGYVGSFVATASGPRTERADPKDKIGLFNLMSDAHEIVKQSKSGGTETEMTERVIAMYKKVVAEDPTVIDAWFSLGNACQRIKRYEEAITYFKRALELKPDYDLPVINMANAYRALGKDDAALAGYEHYLTIDPKNGHVRYEIGQIYLDRGDMARAEQNFRQALEIDPRVAPARNAIGVLAYRRGDLAGAEREVRAALEIRSDVRLAHYNLALIAEEHNDLRTAEAEYRRELELHPDAYKAAFNLGRLYERTGNRTAQIESLKQAVSIDADGPEANVFLAKAYLDAGINLDEAVKHARRSLEVAPRSQLAPLAHYVLADLYNRLGRPDEAAREVSQGRALEGARR